MEGETNRKPKAGVEFEAVVAEVIRALDPRATVKQGEWVEGPDGERECDVLVDGTLNGAPRRVLVECKDYAKPVSVEKVEALASKFPDVGAHAAVLCSNAGFQRAAVSKARRIGVSLVGVMRAGDRRIRTQIVEEMYLRQVTVREKSYSYKLDPVRKYEGLQYTDVVYEGLPAGAWAEQRIVDAIKENPIVHGTFQEVCRLKAPVTMLFRGEPQGVTAITIRFRITGGWYAHQVKIDADGALYDWLRRSVFVGVSKSSFRLEPVDPTDPGVLIARPPDVELDFLRNPTFPGHVTPGGAHRIWVARVKDMAIPEAVPNLTPLVDEVTLTIRMEDVPDAAVTSTEFQDTVHASSMPELEGP